VGAAQVGVTAGRVAVAVARAERVGKVPRVAPMEEEVVV